MTLPRPSRKIDQGETSDEKPVAPLARKINPNAFRPSDIFVFNPKPDITPYEIALLLQVLYEPAIHFKSFLGLPESLQRYFRPTKA